MGGWRSDLRVARATLTLTPVPALRLPPDRLPVTEFLSLAGMSRAMFFRIFRFDAAFVDRVDLCESPIRRVLNCDRARALTWIDAWRAETTEPKGSRVGAEASGIGRRFYLACWSCGRPRHARAARCTRCGAARDPEVRQE